MRALPSRVALRWIPAVGAVLESGRGVKEGMVRYLEPAKGAGGKYTVKNLGNTEIMSFVIVLK